VAEAIKYPNITFNSKSIKQEGNKLSVEGTLNFHGVNKDIAFVAEKTGDKNKIQVTGGFEIKMTDFKIDPPSLMAIATDDEIKIKFSIVY
jgi:polyisoprenoid-binding protein YceI